MNIIPTVSSSGKRPVWRAAGLFLLLMSMTCRVFADDPRVTATLDPAEITLGETSQLNITVEGGGGGVGNISMPQIDGLTFSGGGHSVSSNFQIINGQMSGGTSHIFSYLITPVKTGSYTISTIEVPVGGKKYRASPVTLRVVKSSAGQIAPPSQPAAPPATGGASADEAETAPVQLGFVRIVLPRRELFVGQTVPVEVKAYFSRQTQWRYAPPSFSSDALGMGKLSKPSSETEETVQGVSYAVLSWRLTVTALKPGEFNLAAELPAACKVRNKNRHPFFDDDFFSSFMGGTVEKRVNLRGHSGNVKVLALPSEGKPADFSGAVGRFSIETSASPLKVNAGDPITLKITVKGEGSFDRMTNLSLENAAGWRVYSPSGKFEPADDIGFSGKKTFEQVVIPQRPDIRQIPPIKFNFFDSDIQRYATLASKPIDIEVSGSIPAPAPVSSAPTTQPMPAASGASAAANPTADLVPNKVEPGRPQRLQPYLYRPGFWALQFLPLLLLGAAWGVARRREKIAGNPALARSLAASRAVRAHLGHLNHALQKQDSLAFFNAARRVIQERLAEQWGVQATAITMSEVQSQFPPNSPLADRIRQIFDMADSVAYSGQNFTATTLNDWQGTVLDVLQQLERGRD
ncbi:MAG: BatD family protein [Verrucomicrobiae bacterium]|nr:BatD family protein [Verrucomicrobiae bacterium]